MNEIHISTNALDRVKSAIATDKHFKPNKLAEVLKSDIYMTLNEYADVRGDDFKISVQVNDFGEYIINVCAIARRLKVVGIVPDKL